MIPVNLLHNKSQQIKSTLLMYLQWYNKRSAAKPSQIKRIPLIAVMLPNILNVSRKGPGRKRRVDMPALKKKGNNSLTQLANESTRSREGGKEEPMHSVFLHP